LKIFSQ